MRLVLITLLFCVHSASAQVVSQGLKQVAPEINHWGGLVGSVAVDPVDATDVLIATGSGGLYRSRDGGSTWRHIDGFLNAKPASVSFSPGDRNVILVTAQYDTKTERAGGIWRSTDGGRSWSMPVGSIPAQTARCPERVSAHGISWTPDSDTVWVAGDCGLMKSGDRGASFTQVIVDPATAGTFTYWDSRVRPDRMFVVLAIDERHVVAGGEGGYYYMQDGATWHKSIGAAPGFCPNGLAVVPGNPSLLLRADWDAHRLQYTRDQGVTWIDFPGVGLDTGNQAPFVKTTPSPLGIDYFELYFGDGVKLRRTTLSKDPSRWSPGGASWTDLVLDHPDPLDMAFHPRTGRPILVVGDFGVARSSDEVHWGSVGGGPGGLNAIEVYGLGVQAFGAETDVDFITWHNYAWSSHDNARWTDAGLAEGFNIRVSGPDVTDASQARVAVMDHGNSATVYGRGLQPLATAWVAPRADSCFRHITFFKNPDGTLHTLVASYSCENSQVIYDVQAIGTPRWTEITRTSRFAMYGYPQPARHVDHVSVTHGYVDNAGRILLSRTVGLDGGVSPVTMGFPAMRNFGSLGTMQFNGAEPVFGVKPDDDRIVIAADELAGVMKRSTNGGDDWETLDTLTDLVTDGGRLRFNTIDNNGQPTVVAFDPYWPKRVIVGTRESGVLQSADAGETWMRLPESEQITHVTDIRFAPGGTVYIASSGRGLWQYSRLVRLPREVILKWPMWRDPSTGIKVPASVIGDPEICPACGLVIATRGDITGYEVVKGRLIVTATQPDAVLAHLDDKTALALEVVRSKDGKLAACGSCAADLKAGLTIKALVLDAGNVRAYGAAKPGATIPHALLFASEVGKAYKPDLQLSGVVRAPGYFIAEQGQKITVTGSGFAPTVDGKVHVRPVSLLFHGRIVNSDLVADAQGRFTFSFAITGQPGMGPVSCIQKTASGTLKRELTLVVNNRDRK